MTFFSFFFFQRSILSSHFHVFITIIFKHVPQKNLQRCLLFCKRKKFFHKKYIPGGPPIIGGAGMSGAPMGGGMKFAPGGI